MGFLDWLRQSTGWVYNNVAKPVLTGASYLKRAGFGKVFEAAYDLPYVGSAARVASTVLDKLHQANEWTDRNQDVINRFTQPTGSGGGPGQ